MYNNKFTHTIALDYILNKIELDRIRCLLKYTRVLFIKNITFVEEISE